MAIHPRFCPLSDAPIFGANAFNLSTRIALGAVITVLIFQHVEIPTISPFSFDAIVLMFNEIVVGSFMGLVLQLVTAAVILSGQVVSGGMGLGMANMIDPNLGNIPTLSNFFLVLALLAFLSLGGHLILISLLFDSFTHLPIGEVCSHERYRKFYRMVVKYVYWSCGINFTRSRMSSDGKCLLGRNFSSFSKLEYFCCRFPGANPNWSSSHHNYNLFLFLKAGIYLVLELPVFANDS